MIGQIVKRGDKIVVYHILGESFYEFENEQEAFVKANISALVDFTSVVGDRYGLTSKARINRYLTIAESREFKLNILL